MRSTIVIKKLYLQIKDVMTSLPLTSRIKYTTSQLLKVQAVIALQVEETELRDLEMKIKMTTMRMVNRMMEVVIRAMKMRI
jgi:hypothetical protein